MPLIAWLVAVMGSALAGLVAVKTTEVMPPVFVIAVVCVALGFATPRFAWLSALLVGSGVFASYAVAGLIGYHPKAPPEPNIYASLIAILPAIFFAYVGAGARWLTSGGPRAQQGFFGLWR
jgi:hypothetical protein